MCRIDQGDICEHQNGQRRQGLSLNYFFLLNFVAIISSISLCYRFISVSYRTPKIHIGRALSGSLYVSILSNTQHGKADQDIYLKMLY